MHITKQLAVLALTGSLASAGCVPKGDAPAPAPLTAATIESIDPTTKSCEGRIAEKWKEECHTAAQAADPINKSFEKYGIKTAGEQAALLSLMLFESQGFAYNRNHFPEPGRPGQGTKNMQMADFNKKYAEDVVGKDKVAAAGDPNAVLDLVLGTEYTFGSAAWFLATQCAPEFKTKLADGTKESWTNYITGCVKTTVDEKREKLWKASLDALSKPA